jgi:hypothetical protein
VKISQLQLRLTRNLRQPDLRFISSYDIAGLGTRLDGSPVLGADGSVPGNALTSLGNNQFNSWNLGLRLDVPLGFRDTSAQVRQAHLLVTRNYVQLRDAEIKTLEYLAQQYRNVVQNYTVIPVFQARREALQKYIYKFQVRIDIGQYQSQEYLNFLTAQRDLADAIRQEFAAVAQYNASLAQFEFAKGTILRYNNVQMQEGPLPIGVAKRAADHERERAAGIKLRERPAQDNAPQSPPHELAPAVGSPTLPPILQLPAGPDAIPAPGSPLDKKDVKQPAMPKPLPANPFLNPGAAAPAPKPVVPFGPEAGTNVGSSPVGVPGPGAASTTAPTTGDVIFQPTGETLKLDRFRPVKPMERTPAPIESPIITPPVPMTPDSSSMIPHGSAREFSNPPSVPIPVA